MVGPVKNPNCKFTFVQVVKLLILFPFFSVKNAANYEDSGLGKLFSCKKDVFYRLMDDGRIDWRRIIYSINRQLIGKISRGADSKNAIRCLIIDDTDLPKRGMKAEGLGKVFSHTAMKSILGLKAMFLCYTDSKTQFMLDSTIQAETGKNEDRPQGLTKKQKAAQYTKFLYYVLSAKEKEIMGMQSEGGVPTINTQKVGSIEIPVPPLPVQEEIVRILDTFTELQELMQSFS